MLKRVFARARRVPLWVDDQCVDGGPAPDDLKEPLSAGSADSEHEQKSSLAGGAFH
jgi:hypothetical protein